MKNKLLIVLAVLLPLSLLSCSGGDEENVTVQVSSGSFALIPATAISCLAYRSGTTGTDTSSDVAPSYFRVPVIKFVRKDAASILIISVIRIKITVPGNSATISCDVGGDNLAALSDTWWNNPGRETSVPVSTTTFETDCALYCGGIAAGETSFVATGTMEVFGLERNASTLEEVPVKIQTSISVQNY